MLIYIYYIYVYIIHACVCASTASQPLTLKQRREEAADPPSLPSRSCVSQIIESRSYDRRIQIAEQCTCVCVNPTHTNATTQTYLKSALDHTIMGTHTIKTPPPQKHTHARCALIASLNCSDCCRHLAPPLRPPPRACSAFAFFAFLVILRTSARCNDGVSVKAEKSVFYSLPLSRALAVCVCLSV